MSIENILAKNTNGNNKFLVNHTKMVINFGMRVGELMYNGDADKKQSFLTNLSVSLLLHDIGKISNSFQKYIKGNIMDAEGVENKTETGYFQHHIYSWAYAASRISGMSKAKNQCVLSSILFHHTCNMLGVSSDDVLRSLSDDEIQLMDKFYTQMMNYCHNNFGIEYSPENYSIITDSDDYSVKSIDETNIYAPISLNTTTNREKAFYNDVNVQLIRAIVILSDRLISSGSCNLDYILINNKAYIDELFKNMSESNLTEDINLYDFDFDKERLAKQYELLEKTYVHNHNVIKASAGLGKTLIGLIWFLKWRKRLLWITPRNVIAGGTYKSILKELNKIDLDGKIKVGVYFDGHIIDKNCDSEELDDFDILVTNIDSIVSRTTNNSMAHLLVNMYSSNIVFDEYHEFKMHEGIFSAFIRLMHIRSRYTYSKTLLLSATASNFDTLWGSSIVNYINDTDVLYGDTKVKIYYHEFDKKDNIKIPDSSDDTFVICHTVFESQNTFENNVKEGVVLLHSRFTDNDRKKITDKVLDSHCSPKDGGDINKRKMVVGTNIIGTGLDISCKNLYDFVISPESTIQRCCGRCSRFGEYDEIDYHVCIFKGKINRLVSDDYDNELHMHWLHELQNLDGQTITKTELYSMYEDFYRKYNSKVEGYYIRLFNESSNSLGYIKLRSKHKKTNDKKRLGNSYGYRGSNNSIFVTAKDGQEWCDPITIDYDIIFNPRSDKREGDHRNERKNMMKHYPDRFKYPSNAELKWKYGIVDFTNEDCARIAKCEDSPLPLFDFVYDNILGLKYDSD